MQGRVELVKKGLGRVVNENEETPILKDRTGAEIEQAIIEAKYNAFAFDEERVVITQDIDKALRETASIWNSFQKVIQSPEYQQIIRNAKLVSDYVMQGRR